MNSQTTKVLALRFDLLPENLKKKCADELSGQIRKKFNTHLSTGFLGTPHLLHALSENGHRDLAWELLEQTTFPSWLYSVENGATTIWEHWDSWTPENGFKDPKMNSFNHYAYGAVADWMYENAAGIKIDESKPAFEHIVFAPLTDERLSYVKASIESRHGKVAASWKRENGTVSYEFTVPAGSTATVMLNGTSTEIGEGTHSF